MARKTQSTTIYLRKQDFIELKEAAMKTGLNGSEIIRQSLRKGLRELRANDFALAMGGHLFDDEPLSWEGKKNGKPDGGSAEV